ncbi:MAG: hypothetical protein LUI14_10875 [Lachnospiraceae bacterium]|nr:hypothetical protein [Lachnospiraceae bacterium]
MARSNVKNISGIKDASEPLRSPRKSIHYADKKMIGETPMMVLIQGKKTDYMTPEEVVGTLYGREVDKLDIKFKDEAVG